MERWTATAVRLVSLAETLHRWLLPLRDLGRVRRRRLARYAGQVASTLERAADAVTDLMDDPASRSAARRCAVEFGRIGGYIELIVSVLDGHLDGRKLAGVKRRLERLEAELGEPSRSGWRAGACQRNLVVSAGYFSALADGLRA